MYYTAQDGVKDTWRDYVHAITQQFNQHNWLPAAVGLLMVGWIALIIMGLQQTVLVTPPVPDNTQVGNTGQNLAVTNTSVVTSTDGESPNLTMGNSNGSSTAASNMATPQAAENMASNDVASAVQDEIGGRGADTPPAPVTVPEPTDDVGEVPPVVDPGTIDLEVVVPETPVTPEVPVEVPVPDPTDGIL